MVVTGGPRQSAPYLQTLRCASDHGGTLESSPSRPKRSRNRRPQPCSRSLSRPRSQPGSRFWLNDPIEHGKPPLLALVQALIQRICGVRQFLQGRPGIRKRRGALTQPLDRYLAGRGVAHRAPAIGPKLAEFPRSLLEGRPILLLVRSQGKASLERSQARLTKCPEILRAGLPPLPPLFQAPTLGINQRGAGNSKCRRSEQQWPSTSCSLLNNQAWTTLKNRNSSGSKLKLC